MTTALLYAVIALTSFGVYESQNNQPAAEAVEQAPPTETEANRLKTSDKHQKAVLDYVKG